MIRLVFVVMLLVAASSSRADEAVGIPATRILDLDDNDALGALKAMALTGDNHAKLLAEAWIVLSSIAIGQGRERCGFDEEAARTMWLPALDGMNKDEISELNRVVTSNFRYSQNGQVVDKRKLFPISRQAVMFLSDRNGRWDCGAIKSVQQKADTYMANKAEHK